MKKSKNRVKKRHTRWGLWGTCNTLFFALSGGDTTSFFHWAFIVYICVILELRTWINVCVYVQFYIKHVGQSLLGMFFDVCMLSCFSHVQLFATPWTVTHQAPLSMGFSRPEHWGGLPFPSPMRESESESEVAQSCPTLCDPVDCSPPGSSVHGILQARWGWVWL